MIKEHRLLAHAFQSNGEYSNFVFELYDPARIKKK